MRVETDFDGLMPGVPCGQYPVDVGYIESGALLIRDLLAAGDKRAEQGKHNPFEIFMGDDALPLLARQRPPTDYLGANSGVPPGAEVYFVTPPGESQKSLHYSDRGDYVVFDAASIDTPEDFRSGEPNYKRRNSRQDFNGFTGLIDKNLLHDPQGTYAKGWFDLWDPTEGPPKGLWVPRSEHHPLPLDQKRGLGSPTYNDYGMFYAVVTGRPLGDYAREPVREGSVTAERCFVVPRIVMKAPKGENRNVFVKGARYGGRYDTPYKAAIRAIFDIELREQVFAAHLRPVTPAKMSKEQTTQQTRDHKFWAEQARGVLWFAVRRGYLLDGTEVEGMVTCNFATFRTVMLGSGSVGKAFSVFERARDFALLPLSLALKELDETDPWVGVMPAVGSVPMAPTAAALTTPSAPSGLTPRSFSSPGGAGSGSAVADLVSEGAGRILGTPDALAALGDYADDEDDEDEGEQKVGGEDGSVEDGEDN